jgi:hypothetical protein
MLSGRSASEVLPCHNIVALSHHSCHLRANALEEMSCQLLRIIDNQVTPWNDGIRIDILSKLPSSARQKLNSMIGGLYSHDNDGYY